MRGSIARGCSPEANILALAPLTTGVELAVELAVGALLDCVAVLGDSDDADILDTCGDFIGDNWGGSLKILLFTFLLPLGSNLIAEVEVGASVFFCLTLLRGEMPGLEREV